MVAKESSWDFLKLFRLCYGRTTMVSAESNGGSVLKVASIVSTEDWTRGFLGTSAMIYRLLYS